MQVEESTNHIAHSQSPYLRFRMENIAAFHHFEFRNTESEASISASVVSIHFTAKDSDSDSDASVSQA